MNMKDILNKYKGKTVNEVIEILKKEQFDFENEINRKAKIVDDILKQMYYIEKQYNARLIRIYGYEDYDTLLCDIIDFSNNSFSFSCSMKMELEYFTEGVEDGYISKINESVYKKCRDCILKYETEITLINKS